MTLALAILVLLPPPPVAAAPCDTPIKSKVACENTKTGTPESTWKVSGAGSSNLQGFSTDISVNVGATIGFKIDTTLSSYSMDIYRMGYYQGNGARKIASVSTPTATDQPACKTESTTGLIDCGNWSQSASWTAPSDAVSGIYFALISSGSSKSQIPFVVRDDSSHSDLFMQTSDTTWQAYNSWGGNSFYVGGPGTSGNTPRAYKLSYNRPFATNSGDTVHDYIYNAEYPMVRFLESNGYDVSYTTGVDSDRYGALIKNHKTFLSVGHDEYWSGNQRANVEAARDAGVNLAFFSGNEVFWKTRYENSAYGTTTDHRTLVTYKETHSGAKIDPKDPPTWTGTWRDPRFSPPADGGRPENNLTGTIFTVNCCTTDMHVGGAYKNLRFWRNTRVASLGASQTTTLGDGILGYEWDESPDNGFRPAGLVFLSSDSQNVSSLLQDYGSTYAPGSATHHLTLYRAPSGALVFGAGSVQWAWGLDDDHATDGPTNTVDVAVQQATVNLFADMGAQPTTLQSGLVAAAASTDTTPPTSAITAPADGATVAVGSPLTISGTASDVGGVVAGVEVSIDGGTSWHPATGTTSWSYAFTPSVNGTLSIKSRATDDSARTENPGAGRTVTVGSGTPPAGDCPCTIWPSSATPVSESDEDNAAIEVGVKFRANQNGFITGLRFYKGGLNTGTHVGSLWSAGGTKLASATFTNESGSGWQQVDFATPVPVTANTTYVASYYASNGHYASTDGYFTTPTANGPLTALADNADGPNGVYKYGGTGFPTLGYSASNYWVDVVFVKSSAPDTTKPTVTSRQPAPGAASVDTSIKPSATFSEGVSNATIALTKQSDGTTIIGATSYDAGSQTATFTPTVSLEASTTYTVAVSGAKDAAGNVMDPVSWSYTTAGTISSGCPCTIWPSTALPASAADPDNGSIEVGVKFRANQAGWINGVRFYKDSTNTGTHVGSLWSSTGARLASATFTGESTSGWQEVAFATPVPVTANTTYVASYLAPAGHYSVSESYFTAATTNGPLTALADNTDGPNGVYLYGTGGFPTQTYASSNYWVDVVFSTSTTPPPDTTKPTVASHQPGSSAVDVATAFKPTATFSEDVSNASITMKNGSTTVAGTTSYDSPSKTATFTPSAALANATTYTVTVTGAKDAAGNVMDDLTWTFTTVAAVDTTPPTITARAPAASATGVATSTTVTATFSEPVQAATIAMTVTPAGGSAVAGSVAYNATSRMATFTPTAALATSTTYTVAVSGTKDIAGNVMAPLTWTFTTAAPPATGSSIWASTVTPKVLADSDTAATELGVKFRTTTAGTITGIRFYKGPGNTGTHVGTLWSKAGVELAKVTFTGETASGWQQATFTTPVTVTANTTYVASYNAPNGHYSVNESYFSAAVTNGPLTALKNGTDGVNGVYRYGTRAFPSTGYKSSNYWVDVLFTS